MNLESLKKIWHDLQATGKPTVRVDAETVDGIFLGRYSALIDTGSRWSAIPGIVIPGDGASEFIEVDLQLPHNATKRIVVPARERQEFGIWLSAPQPRYGSHFALRFGQHVARPVTLFFVPAPRAMEPHLILGCDFLFSNSGFCIDRAGSRFRLSICGSPSDVPR